MQVEKSNGKNDNLQTRVVITGASSAGKSALISMLRREGFNIFDEASYSLVLAKRMGKPVPDDAFGFQEAVFKKQVEYFDNAAGYCTFYDRGMLDSLAYMQKSGMPWPAEWIDIVNKKRYNVVFWAASDERIFTERNIESPHSYDYHLALGLQIKKTYELFGYEVLKLPMLNIELGIASSTKQRADFVITYLRDHCLLREK